ncbi:MAG: hypothetical protein ACKO7W_01245 [Elainella sp.]
MHNDRTVYGVTADLAKEFHPHQWVNLYQLDPTNREQELHYLGRYRVKDLPSQIAEQADGFALEPVDEQGNVISVQQALDESS